MKALILALCLVPLSLLAQRSNQVYYSMRYMNPMLLNMEDYQWYFLKDKLPIDQIKKNKIESIEFATIVKGKKKYAKTYSFNENGRIVKIKGDNYLKENKYENDSLLVFSETKYKKRVARTERKFSDAKLDSMWITKNDKVTGKYWMNYTDHDAISELKYATGKNLKKKYLLKHEYEEGKLKRTEYHAKGKLDKVWVYDCKKKGEEIPTDKTEELSSSCRYNEESSDGSYSVFERRIEKGKVYLTQAFYTKDSVFYESKKWLSDTILVAHFKKMDDFESYSSFDKKGKHQYSYEKKKNEEGLLIEQKNYHSPKRKLSSTSTYRYKNGLLTSERRVRKNKLSYERSLNYTYRKEI